MINQYYGATAVIENYLDGALYDLENGTLDNWQFVSSAILGLKKLNSYSAIKYEEKLEKWKKDNNIKDDEIQRKEE